MHGRRVLAALLPITFHALVVGLFPSLPLFDGLAVPIAAYLLVRLAPPLTPRQRWFLLFGAAAVFQLGVFRQVWHFGEGGRHALVGGVIPWSDAGELLGDALRKVHGEDYDVRSTTRPMYPAIFGLVFFLTGENVPLTLLVFAAIGLGLAAAVTNAVWAARGPTAAAIVLTVLLFFARRFFIVIGTETLGFAFGAVAFLCLWKAASQTDGDVRDKVVPDDVTIPAGVLFLSLGIVTRAGPMLAPLAVVLWVWRTTPAGRRLGIVVRCVVAMAVAFAVNTTLVRTMGEGLAYADFPPILYGVLHGEDQKYVLQAHPEILALEQPASSHAIMALVASEVRTQPWLVVTGALRSMGSFVGHPDGLFSLVFYDPDDLLLEGKGAPMEVVARFVRDAGPYRALNLVAMALAGIAFVVATVIAAVRSRRGGPRETLLFYVAVAVLLSSAVTPAWTSEAVRLQAATLCFLVAIVTGLPAPAPLSEGPAFLRPHRAWAIGSTVAVLGMYVIAWSTLQARPRARVASCRSFDRLALVPSTLVEIRAEGSGGYTPSRARRNVLYLQKHNPELSEPIAENATAGMGIEVAYDPCAMKTRVLLHPADALRRLGGRSVRVVEGVASKEGVIVARALAAE